MYHEVGLDQFVYYLADYPELIDELLEVNVSEAIAWVEHLPRDLELDAVFLADDIAFQSGPLLNPKWFERAYFSRVARIFPRFIGAAPRCCSIPTAISTGFSTGWSKRASTP